MAVLFPWTSAKSKVAIEVVVLLLNITHQSDFAFLKWIREKVS